MRLNEIRYDNALPIDGYAPGFWRVGGKLIEGHALVLPSGAGHWGGLEDMAPLLEAAELLDVLFVGTGAEMAYLPQPFRTAMEGAGIAAEPMASPAAARTYNVLLSEGRRVGAALLAL
ncbi:Mth938-like domain-containing protein [Pseudoroseicyclus sp. CXY001]|uniref:Mth938-like domain-containing protein n=1 Tax=Pseudoroseicyclus sp. CXY001 TaxID=3242492 RepID=UPI00358DA7A7